MRTICCVFLFFFLCAGGYARKNTPAGQIFRTKPCLQSLTGNGITVSWLTHVPVYSWVEYGTDTLELEKARTMLDGQAVCNNHIHKIRLENLEAGKTYFTGFVPGKSWNMQRIAKPSAIRLFRRFILSGCPASGKPVLLLLFSMIFIRSFRQWQPCANR